MINLFNKAAVFSDIHVGLKNNSTLHNQDCEEFVDWYIATAKENGCEVGIFSGDWHHNRNTLNIVTMDYSLRMLEKLGAAFDEFYFFPGNHDLFYKDKRDIHSVEFGKYIPGITVIQKPVTIGDVTLCPWLVQDEWKHLNKHKGRYIFGHFELPNFMMNAQVRMPNHNEIQLEDFTQYELGFSGHFHKRQCHKNMHYIGNAFPHNYSDTWDDERGMMILEWGGQPEFHTWPNQPTFRTLTLSKLLDESATILKPKQHLRVTMDIDISFEEASFIKETFLNDHQLREFSLIADRKDVDLYTDDSVREFKTVDQLVSSEIINIDSDTYDKNVLLSIFNNL